MDWSYRRGCNDWMELQVWIRGDQGCRLGWGRQVSTPNSMIVRVTKMPLRACVWLALAT